MELTLSTNEPNPVLSNLAAEGIVPPNDFAGCPDRVAEIAGVSLEIPALQDAKEQISAQGFYDIERLEDAVVSVILGNLILAGPPGTGKTKLSKLLAEAFNVNLRTETANPEWSVYDVIGSQVLNAQGGTQPKHGIVTSSIIDCASTTVRQLDKGQGPQGEWLLIDEINRAEIDRAFGPLFTALSGEDEGSYSLDYIDGSPRITIPKRFRIVCTMNDYDTRFVNSMSGALRRRFARVLVMPPENVDGMVPQAELSLAIEQAHIFVASRLGDSAQNSRALLESKADELRKVFGGIRRLDTHEGIAIGTSQLIDCCTYAMAYLATIPPPDSEEEWGRLLDRILETRLVSGLETDSTRIRLSDTYVDLLTREFPKLTRTTSRLRKFLHGSI